MAAALTHTPNGVRLKSLPRAYCDKVDLLKYECSQLVIFLLSRVLLAILTLDL